MLKCRAFLSEPATLVKKSHLQLQTPHIFLFKDNRRIAMLPVTPRRAHYLKTKSVAGRLLK